MCKLSKADALEIAKVYCDREGIPWNDQTRVYWGFRQFTVWGGGRKGGNLRMRIRRSDGEILEASVPPY
jgi:hypothetical protein